MSSIGTVASALCVTEVPGCLGMLPSPIEDIPLRLGIFPPFTFLRPPSPPSPPPQAPLSITGGELFCWQLSLARPRARSPEFLFTQLSEGKRSPEDWLSHSLLLSKPGAPWLIAPGTRRLTNKLGWSGSCR